MYLLCQALTTTGWSLYIPIFTAFITIFGSAIVWYLNGIENRRQEDYKRKEERYINLIKSIRGFYVGVNNKELKEQFLLQINLC